MTKTKPKQASNEKSRPQHAFGDWRLSDDMRGVDNLPVYGVETVEGQGIANCGIKKDKRNLANAHLIAAAPELLAALIRSESFISGFEGDELQESIGGLLAEIRAAIARARGQQIETAA